MLRFINKYAVIYLYQMYHYLIITAKYSDKLPEYSFKPIKLIIKNIKYSIKSNV